MNRHLLEEIRRFKLMVGYDPTEVLSEQIRIVEAVTFFGVTNLYYVKNEDYVNAKHIGYIEDDTKKMVLNKDGQKILNKLDVPFEQLMAQGTVVTDTFLEKFVEDQESRKTKLDKVLTSIGGADWKMTTQGSGVMVVSNNGRYPIATNIEGPSLDPNRSTSYNLLSAEVTPYATKTTVRQEGPKVTVFIGDANIGGTNKAFCDNMVKVNLTDKKNEEELNKIVNEIITYINAPDDENGRTALSKLNNMTIQGQADSARPTWSPGPPCNSTTTELDHDYGGIEKKPKEQTTEEERHKMNKYLAEYRAKNYKNEIITRVKEKTGIDITITELEPLEYYGKGESYRGPQYRTMLFVSNAPKHTYNDTNKTGKSSEVINYEKLKSAGYDMVKIKELPTGQDTEIDLNAVMASGTNKFYVENNNTLIENFSDYTSIALPSIEIEWGNRISTLGVQTHDGKTYFLPMTVGNACEAYTKLKQSAGSQRYLIGPQYPQLESCSKYQQYEKPLTYYDSSENIVLDGKTYYRLLFFGFFLVPTATTSGDKTVIWPTEEDVKSEKQHQLKGYTQKELDKIKQLAYIK